MSQAEELWSAVRAATTLRAAHDTLVEVMPSLEATRAEWRDFHFRAAVVYRRIAETDRGRRREALFLAEQHSEKGEKIAHSLAAAPTARSEPGGAEGASARRTRIRPDMGDPRYTVRLRDDEFRKIAQLAGFHSDYALARAMGLNRSTVTRVRAGELRPGPKFISGALKALAPLGFEDLFEIEKDE